ncbi:MAG: hypothetical protein LBG64_01730 [Pseudomonadales bacterium]|jgi:hypothetical protein|nr:hypothetical protein [Pseudomonadales bacterium]
MAKTQKAEARMHFSETKTWQRAQNIYVEAAQELNAIDELESEMIRHRILRHILKSTNCLAQAVDSYKSDQKKYYFHCAISACLDAQSEILVAKAANYFDLTSMNDEISILIRQIGANINHINEKNEKVVDKETAS